MQFVLMLQLLAKTEVTPCEMPFYRGVMSDVVNTVYTGFILLTLPIFLARSESAIDFVKDSFAVAFISTLDDDTIGKMIMARNQGRTKEQSEIQPLKSRLQTLEEEILKLKARTIGKESASAF